MVVYRTIPTSNHNDMVKRYNSALLYIVLFLHQTTTLSCLQPSAHRCISYYSYIKPQLDFKTSKIRSGCISYYSYIKPQQPLDDGLVVLRCISYYSYIKPQHYRISTCPRSVVYRTIPTSNHNFMCATSSTRCVVYRTIPTSNHNNPMA